MLSEGTVAEGGNGVRITLGLPLSKLEFRVEQQAALKSAIRGSLGLSVLDVVIEDVSDKPTDYKGGGSDSLPLLYPFHASFSPHHITLTLAHIVVHAHQIELY